jgi:diguanylate cyclase (GGDEF)-like protein
MHDGDNKDIKGIRINQLNTTALMVSCILFLMVLLATLQVSRKYRDLITSANKYMQCERAVTMIENGSDYLTEQVRLFVVTKEKKYSDNYFTELNKTRRREQGLDNLIDCDISETSLSYLEHALKYSNALTDREVYAMKLAAVASGLDLTELAPEIQNTELSPDDRNLSPEEMDAAARDLVFNSSYQDVKAMITVYTSYFGNSVTTTTRLEHENNAQALHETLILQGVLLSALFIITCLTFMMIITLIIRPLKIYLKNIRDDTAMEIVGAYEFKYLALTYNNIYELNAANQQRLRYKAEHDPLTGMLNRSILESLDVVLSRQQSPLALLMIDVDHFKTVNDQYGHGIGDQILNKVAQLLKSSFRSNDLIIRMGGDEFAVIMLDVGVDKNELLADKMQQINQSLQNPDDNLPSVSLSIGIAFSKNGYEEGLFKKADQALYHAKKNGRSCCQLYEEVPV